MALGHHRTTRDAGTAAATASSTAARSSHPPRPSCRGGRNLRPRRARIDPSTGRGHGRARPRRRAAASSACASRSGSTPSMRCPSRSAVTSIADVDDEPGYEQTGDGVRPPKPEGNADQAQQGASRGESVEPRVLGVSDQGRRLDAPADLHLVAGHELVADDADHGGCHPEPEVGGPSVAGEFVEAHKPANRASPRSPWRRRDRRCPRPARSRRGADTRWPVSSRHVETDEHHRRGGDIRQVVQGVTEQTD